MWGDLVVFEGEPFFSEATTRYFFFKLGRVVYLRRNGQLFTLRTNIEADVLHCRLTVVPRNDRFRGGSCIPRARVSRDEGFVWYGDKKDIYVELMPVTKRFKIKLCKNMSTLQYIHSSWSPKKHTGTDRKTVAKICERILQYSRQKLLPSNECCLNSHWCAQGWFVWQCVSRLFSLHRSSGR